MPRRRRLPSTLLWGVAALVPADRLFVSGHRGQGPPASLGPAASRVPPPVELVVTAYKEGLEWIAEDLAQIRPEAAATIYCKGPTIQDPRCNRLDNVGTEEYGYLNHIVAHYDDLAPVTVFAVGSVSFDWARCSKLHWILDQVSTPERREQFGGFAAVDGVQPGQRVAFDPAFDISSYATHLGGFQHELVRPSVAPLGAWYRRFVHPDVAQAVRVGTSWNGIFAVTADRIRRFPRSVYEGMLREVERCGQHAACTVGHFIERSWKPMFAQGSTLGGNASAFNCARLPKPAPRSARALLELTPDGHQAVEPRRRPRLSDSEHPPPLSVGVGGARAR